MTPLRIIKGDATSPQAKGPKIVAHVCNDIGGWARGSSWRSLGVGPSRNAISASGTDNDFALGATRLVQVQPDIWVANMIGRHGIKAGSAGPPIRYEALARSLAALGDEAERLGASVHMPRIGCGLSGGHWDRVEPLVVAGLCQRDIAVTEYDF